MSGIGSLSSSNPIELRSGITKTSFKQKVEDTLNNGNLTQKEFQELAKDIKDGGASIKSLLAQITPDKDVEVAFERGRVPVTPVQRKELLSILNKTSEAKPAFADTRAMPSKTFDALKQINKEFDVTGGMADTFKDAVTDEHGKFDLSRTVRTTSEYSKKAQDGIHEVTVGTIDAISKATDEVFAGIDKIAPEKTFSAAVGDFEKAINAKDATKMDKVSAFGSVAWSAIKSGAGTLTRAIAKTVVGTVSFAASMATSAVGIVATGVVKVGSVVAGSVEAIGRTVAAPILRGAVEATGKVALGAGAIAGGTVATLGNAANVGNWMGKLGTSIKDSSVGKAISEKFTTNSDREMASIDKMMASSGIGSDVVADKTQAVKTDRLKSEGFADGKMGIKDTMKKWWQISFGPKSTGVITLSSSLAGGKFAANLADSSQSAKEAFSHMSTAGQTAVGIGLVAGPLTVAGSAYKIYQGSEELDKGNNIKKVASTFQQKADQDIQLLEKRIEDLSKVQDPEREILRLKNKVQELKDLKMVAKLQEDRAGTGLTKLGIAQNSVLLASGVASTAATTAAYLGAATVVAATGPVGLGLAGVGLAVTAGVATYKIVKAEKREERNDKLAAQQQLVEDKMGELEKNLEKNSDKYQRLNDLKGKIVSMRLQKDPKFAGEYLASKAQAGSAEARELSRGILEAENPEVPHTERDVRKTFHVVAGDNRRDWASI